VSAVRRDWLPLLLVVVLLALYVLNFGVLSVLKHSAFQTHTADLGNMDQPIWNTLHGRFVEETKDDGTQGTRLTDHVEPVLALVSLSFLVYDGVESILVLQTVAIALGALPVYWLARRRLRSAWAGVAFAAVYLLLPQLQAANLTEFHAVPLAVAPLLFTFLFIEEEKPLGMWVAAVLALSVKEEIALLVFMLGLYAVIFGKRRVHGGALAALSLAWFALTTFAIIPHYSASGNSVYVGRYQSLGGGFGSALRSLLTRPADVIRLLLSGGRPGYVFGLLAGTGFLPLFWPVALLMGAPVLAANLLSDYPAMFSGEFHYSAPVMPFIIIGAIYGVGWLCDRLVRRGLRRSHVLAVLLAWALLWSVGYSHFRGFVPWSLDWEVPPVTAHHRLFERFAAQIPPEAVISTTPPLFPHLSHRPVIYLFPDVRDADYVLIDVSGVTDMHPNDVFERFHELTDGGGFGILDAADGYILLQRGIAGLPELPDAFYDFARVTDPQPQYPVTVDFGGYLRFRGFDLSDRYRWRLTKTRAYWEVLDRLPAGMCPYPFFVDDSNQVVEDTTQRPMVAPLWYPPDRWQPGEVIVTETVPWDLGDSFYPAVGVLWGIDWEMPAQRVPVASVTSADVIRLFDGDTWVRLQRFERRGGRLHVSPETLSAPPAHMDYPAHADFGHLIDLLGADVESREGVLRVTLFWQARARPDRDYTVFVHLLRPDGTLITQHDGMPKNNGLPTSAWFADEVVEDVHTLDLPDGLAAGDCRLDVGLYVMDTLERLPLFDASGAATGNNVSLGPLSVHE